MADMQKKWDKVLNGDFRIGHPTWPPFQQSINIGDVGHWNSVKRRWTTEETYEDLTGKPYAHAKPVSNVRSEVSTVKEVDGEFRIDADDLEIEDGTAKGRGHVEFGKKNAFYLYVPYASGEEVAVMTLARKVFDAMDGDVKIGTHVVYKVLRALRGGVFMGSEESSVSADIKASYEDAGKGEYDSTFKVSRKKGKLTSSEVNLDEDDNIADYAFRLFRFKKSAQRRKSGADLRTKDIEIDPFL